MEVKKSQVTMEFLFLIGFLFILSLGFVIAASIQLTDFREKKNMEIISDFGESIKKEIDIASVVKEGYSRKIDLPEKIDGTIEYNISIINSTLVIGSSDNEFIRVIPKIAGELQKNKSNIITNSNNSLRIENA